MCRILAYVNVLFFVLPLLANGQADRLVLDYSNERGLFIDWNAEHGITIFRMSRYLGVDVKEIASANPSIDLSILDIGTDVILPLNKSRLLDAPATEGLCLPAYYQTKPGETMFRLARIYADKPVNIIKSLNKKTDNALSTGEWVLLGWVAWPEDNLPATPLVTTSPSEDIQEPSDSLETMHVPPVESMVESEPEYTEDYVLAGPSLSDTLHMPRQITRKGIAYWDIRDSTATEFMALHPTAPVNSKIILYNPMMDRSVIATVVSKLDENSYPNNISVVISPSVAAALGALDRRFLVKMTYFD